MDEEIEKEIQSMKLPKFKVKDAGIKNTVKKLKKIQKRSFVKTP